MTRTTQQIREAWSPACSSKLSSLVDAYAALDGVFKRHGYRPRRGVTGAYNCRRITGGSGYSLHAYGPGSVFTFWTAVAVTTAVAVDVNWDKNPYGPRLVTDMPRAMIDDVYKIKTIDGLQVWRWGGYYSNNKDAMHFEVVVSPAELARGIDGTGEDEMTPDQSRQLEQCYEALFTKRGGKVYEHLNVLDKMLQAIGQKLGVSFNPDGSAQA